MKDSYYQILGCSETSTTEQILAEFKIRARASHPDKSGVEDSENFKLIQEAKNVLCDEKLKSMYDKWLHSGLDKSTTFAKWRVMGDAVRMTMHWATPSTSGRMLESPQLKTAETDVEKASETVQINEDESQDADEYGGDITYEPLPYSKMGLTIAEPPASLNWNDQGDNGKSCTVDKSGYDAEGEDKTGPLAFAIATDDSQPRSPTVPLHLRRLTFARGRSTSMEQSIILAERVDAEKFRSMFRSYMI